MSKFLVDVVNFNADASCLASDRWIGIIQGGKYSEFYKWLKLYVENQKKIVIGFPGATIADISTINPESIALINQYPEIFQIILRPFSHDLAILRNPNGFKINMEYGLRVIRKEFKNIANYYLPPEFMLTDEQIFLMGEFKIDGTFVNPNRYSDAIKKRIPNYNYDVKGIYNSKLKCLPFLEKSASHYLDAIQKYEVENWNNVIAENKANNVFSWRDGESSFFLPNGLTRENYWLKNEGKEIVRGHLNSSNTQIVNVTHREKNILLSYPVHSCLSWMRELKMIGFINRLNKAEESIQCEEDETIYYWLMAINSDILSSIEKDSPVVSLKMNPSGKEIDLCLYRSERWHEGIEYLNIFENILSCQFMKFYEEETVLPSYIKKLIMRINYLKSL
jgi:hypothetical protein